MLWEKIITSDIWLALLESRLYPPLEPLNPSPATDAGRVDLSAKWRYGAVHGMPLRSLNAVRRRFPVFDWQSSLLQPLKVLPANSHCDIGSMFSLNIAWKFTKKYQPVLSMSTSGFISILSMSTILVTNKKMRYHVDLSIELKHPVDDPIAT
jgi:hypothetical protein